MDAIIRCLRYQPSFKRAYQNAHNPDSELYDYMKMYFEVFERNFVDFYNGKVYFKFQPVFGTWIYDHNFAKFKYHFYKFLKAIFPYKFLCEKEIEDEEELKEMRGKLLKLSKAGFCHPFLLARYWEENIFRCKKEETHIPTFNGYFSLLSGKLKKDIGTKSTVRYPYYYSPIKGRNKEERRFQKLIGGLLLYRYLVVVSSSIGEEFARSLEKCFYLDVILMKRPRFANTKLHRLIILKSDKIPPNFKGLIITKRRSEKRGFHIRKIPKRIRGMDNDHLFRFILGGCVMFHRKYKGKFKRKKMGKYGIFQKVVDNINSIHARLEEEFNLDYSSWVKP
jgi:hypothetical protein